MPNLSPQFPLYFSSGGGYASNNTIKEVVKQNFKNLILTSPGERVMIPEFGVGLRNFLFEQNVESTIEILSQTIQEQVSIYMPFVELQAISPLYDESQLIINIQYFITPISTVDILSVAT